MVLPPFLDASDGALKRSCFGAEKNSALSARPLNQSQKHVSTTVTGLPPASLHPSLPFSLEPQTASCPTTQISLRGFCDEEHFYPRYCLRARRGARCITYCVTVEVSRNENVSLQRRNRSHNRSAFDNQSVSCRDVALFGLFETLSMPDRWNSEKATHKEKQCIIKKKECKQTLVYCVVCS